MQLYPAIDIRGGQCVRLTQGLFDQAKVYAADPAEVAKLWKSQGASWLHLVDLDGALAGRSVNEGVIQRIIRETDLPVELGGGIRTLEAAGRMLDLGVSRVIIGTKAAKEPEFMKELVDRFGPEAIVAGVDAKNGQVAVEGWETLSSRTALSLCMTMKEMGIRHIVYTDISRDGTLTGPNVEATRELTQKTGLDVIASGGVSSMEDLRSLSEAGIRGAIIGKALYEKKIRLSEAIEAFEGRSL
ncbi:MAG TPA: 1-(5-phosphoribosyl)-5-[(5-phosphoribosylamino)methylideneamino]imidazole-4-carboxamide isomerase [Candidatus Enterocloster faecavium]|uniref:1-(5-phosphoribosyl)-5-[(5-phosphoribosylamino)methylideneamino] imidazole-4-carboxamide isomerase n=1 Tax=Candidatus Enterocloster faecavium TaxID=2838560 RepID=A0A9D2L7T0_9FIRM|nr:1-(5-phosphoribosyl)-5-[(5-phosphoribosylamino)methylideneamino]imidazole-4-carboxamide isomerase [Candidatus Enterocloster faecavium]